MNIDATDPSTPGTTFGVGTTRKLGFYGATPRPFADASADLLAEWETQVRAIMAKTRQERPPWLPWRTRRALERRTATLTSCHNALEQIAFEQFLRETADLSDTERARLALNRIGLIF